jgi:hypothetical protein
LRPYFIPFLFARIILVLHSANHFSAFFHCISIGYPSRAFACYAVGWLSTQLAIHYFFLLLSSSTRCLLCKSISRCQRLPDVLRSSFFLPTLLFPSFLLCAQASAIHAFAPRTSIYVYLFFSSTFRHFIIS